MQVVSMTEAKDNFNKIFENVYRNKEEVIVHKNEKANVVIIPLEEYNSIKETNYLLSSKKNRDILLKSLSDIRNGKVFEKELIEK